jgi:hypothetical protein
LIAAEKTRVTHPKFSVEKSLLIDVLLMEKQICDAMLPRKPLQLLGFPRFLVFLQLSTGDGTQKIRFAICVSNVNGCCLLHDFFSFSLVQ